MIEKAEIDLKAGELGVHTSHVQRDYVFGWLLAGLYDHGNPLSSRLLLKGGNALRKAYFDHGRFSNDLDFSTQTELDEETLRTGLEYACSFAGSGSGVEFFPENTRVGERARATEDAAVYEGRIYFKSFYGEEDVTLKVDLDVKEFDRIFLPVQSRQLIHSYSDYDRCVGVIQCLKLEELLAAKLKALLQRRHSPDLYDFVYSVFVQNVLDISRKEVMTTFLKKTIYEPNPSVARGLLLELPFQVIRDLWDRYLVFPRVSSISFDDAERTFRDGIASLFDLIAPTQPIPAYAGAPISYYPGSQRESIIEAGRLLRLLRVTYDGFTRVVEPYALVFKRKRDATAREYLYVWDRSGGRSGEVGIKSFLPEKVRSVEMLEETFEPKYPVELTKASGFFGGPFTSKPRVTRAATPRFGSTYGITYTVECPYCGKRFSRKSYDTKLNKHQDKYGNPCYGRVGFVV